MSKKQDKAILRGFARGGATDIQFVTVGKGYRRCFMTVPGIGAAQVQKIPLSSTSNDTALERKARDMARRFVKYQTACLTW